MTLFPGRQPDQQAHGWDRHVGSYEEVLEPLTTRFAGEALARLELPPGARVLDVAAGCGGAALMFAAAGARVTAVDLSAGMVARIRERAAELAAPIEAQVMDGEALAFPSESFDAAISVFGVILFPDAARGLAEMRRVVRPGGRVAVVTWTQPARYELAALLREATLEVWPDSPPPPAPPAQLRYVEESAFRALFAAAGFARVDIATVAGALEAPSPRWLVERLAFAPGMAAMMEALGDRRRAVTEALLRRLEARKGPGPLTLQALAFVGTAEVP